METIKNYVEHIINNMKKNHRLFELVSKDSNRMKQQVLTNVKTLVKTRELSSDAIEHVYSLVDELVYSK